MKIIKGLIPLLITINVVWGAEGKTKKPAEKHKKTGKRQIGYGLEAIPGVAFHPTQADDGLLAIARPTAHGGYNLVQPIGLIHAPQDNVGFTGQGFIGGFQGGYGVYASPALVAAPIVDVHNAPKTHQLDGGWKGIDYGHGSIKHGHEIAQSLISKAHPYQDGIIELAPVLPVVPHYDYGKSSNVFSSNALVPMYSGFGTTGRDFSQVQNVKPFNSLSQGEYPKGYSFATSPLNQVPHVGQAPLHTAGHIANNKGHGSVNHGHQLATHGHQLATHGHQLATHGHQLATTGHHLAKRVHIPNVHRGFIGSHGPKLHQEKAHLYTHQFGKKPVHPSASFGPSAPNRQNYQSVPRPIGTNQNHPTHDSTSHSTSYSTDFNPPQSSYSPDFNPASGFGSSELSDVSHTNGHGGYYTGEKKATSFQSFIIHSYKPHQTSHKSNYERPESDENISAVNYNSAQALSGENHF